MGSNWWHMVLCCPEEILRASFNEEWDRSRMPMICACLVVAWLNWIPRTWVVSPITSDINWVPSFVMMVVGRYAWRVMVFTSTRAKVLSSILVTQYVNMYRERSSMAVAIAVYPLDGSLNGKLSIRVSSADPIASLDVLINGGMSSLLYVRLVCVSCIVWCAW